MIKDNYYWILLGVALGILFYLGDKYFLKMHNLGKKFIIYYINFIFASLKQMKQKIFK